MISLFVHGKYRAEVRIHEERYEVNVKLSLDYKNRKLFQMIREIFLDPNFSYGLIFDQ